MRLDKMYTLKQRDGFTLVELLVVIAIIGILAAIAIPQFANYRKRAFEDQVRQDLKNAAIAQESYYADSLSYKSGPLTSGTPRGYNRSAPVTMTSQIVGNAFVLTATHSNCAGVTWSYNSVGGQVSPGVSCP